MCALCDGDEDCEPASACDAAGTCRDRCREDLDCPTPGESCAPATGLCVECRAQSDCPAGDFCVVGRCVDCLTDEHCPAGSCEPDALTCG